MGVGCVSAWQPPHCHEAPRRPYIHTYIPISAPAPAPAQRKNLFLPLSILREYTTSFIIASYLYPFSTSVEMNSSSLLKTIHSHFEDGIPNINVDSTTELQLDDTVDSEFLENLWRHAYLRNENQTMTVT